MQVHFFRIQISLELFHNIHKIWRKAYHFEILKFKNGQKITQPFGRKKIMEIYTIKVVPNFYAKWLGDFFDQFLDFRISK